jgi:hypothetical protein
MTLRSAGAFGTFGIPVGGDVPIDPGIIALWSGTVAAIPSGWALCDGANGTPDLRDRFIVGADAASAGTSGGTASPRSAIPNHANHDVTQPGNHAAHNVTQPDAHTDVPNHTHPVTDPGHAHAIDRWGHGTGVSANKVEGTNSNTDQADANVSTEGTGVTTANPAGGVASQPHAGTAVDAHSVHAGAAVDAHSAHAVQTWYALAYIMKV